MPILPLTLAAAVVLLADPDSSGSSPCRCSTDHYSNGVGPRGRYEPAGGARVTPERRRRSTGVHCRRIGSGATIGTYNESSGGGRVLADWLLEKFGRRPGHMGRVARLFPGWLAALFRGRISLVLIPVIWSLTKESKKSLLYFGMPMATAATVAHALIPLHPGPAAAPPSCSKRFKESDSLWHRVVHPHDHFGRHYLRSLDRPTAVHPGACFCRSA